MRTPGNVDVIVLNGGSSSGKSSLAACLQERLEGTWLTLGVDDLIRALSHGPADTTAGAHLISGPTVPSLSGMHSATPRVLGTKESPPSRAPGRA